MDFLDSLPSELYALPLSKAMALESYGINVEDLYPDEVLDLERLGFLDVHNDPAYHEHCADVSAYAVKGVKRKKENDYKRNMKCNLIVTNNV